MMLLGHEALSFKAYEAVKGTFAAYEMRMKHFQHLRHMMQIQQFQVNFL
jgi:hypothetical protein